jgi:uncharacterized protein YdaU (DUF1376 family)
MAKPDAWMPLYVADYRADTTRLNTEQHGAYLLILIDYWRNGPPPDDDRVLSQITGLTLARWKSHRPVIQGFFKIVDGVWRQKRADKEMTKAAGLQETLSKRGKKGAEARWNKDDTGNATSMQQALPSAMPSTMPSTMLADAPSPSPTPSTKSKALFANANGEWEAFWNNYPNKAHKEGAIGQWKRVKAADVPTIMASLASHKATEQWQRGIIPHARTWLNQRRWKDELQPLSTLGQCMWNINANRNERLPRCENLGTVEKQGIIFCEQHKHL